MMQTEALIQSLAADLRPVDRNAVERRIGLGMIAGAAVTLALVASLLGFRADLPAGMAGGPFLMKWAYTISIGLCAIAGTVRLARPEAARATLLWLMLVPFGLLGAIAAIELVRTPTGGWLALWLGQSWSICGLRILALSAPIFLGLTWSFRRLAPTRLRLTGAVAGMTSGAWGATLYGLHCPEASALFVLTWYTLGIGFATLGGALVGPRLFRW